MTTAPPKRVHNRDATCSAILSATAAIITEKGLDNFTISEIGRRAKVNRALIYHYYQNRENLITHAVDWIMERNNLPASKLSGDAVAKNAQIYIEHPEIGRFVFQLLLSGRPLLRLGERLKENLAHVDLLMRQQFPEADEDATFCMVILALSQFAWSFSRQELANSLGISLQEADERFLQAQRQISELGLKELAGEPVRS
ncbi:MAG: TetR/AcrR family transcriptional regulator [Chloroflexi bacterium]|nr:TetR/AcrR family transcriptional regulator [Chloroflexota bacterium]